MFINVYSHFMTGSAKDDCCLVALTQIRVIRSRKQLIFTSYFQIISQPGDAIYVLPFALEKYGGPFGIAYDVGTSDVCGVTYSGVLHMSSWTVHSLNILDECWMMSISFDLSPVNWNDTLPCLRINVPIEFWCYVHVCLKSTVHYDPCSELLVCQCQMCISLIQ